MSEINRLVDGDALITKENFIFTVIGYEHPKDRFFCFLKYIPAELKKFFSINFLKRTWNLKEECVVLFRAEKLYTAKNYQVLLNAFRNNFSEYIYFCPYRQKEIISVPKNAIKKTFPAKKCMEKLLTKKDKDALEHLATELVMLLSESANVPLEDFGLRGSLALNMHSLESDVDLAVYGAKNFRRVETAVEELVKEGKIRYIISRKIDFQRRFRGKYKNKVFMYNGVRKPEEINVHYGKYSYKPIKSIKFRCQVIDDSEGMFRPAIYQIDNYTPLDEESKLENEQIPKTIVSMVGHYRNIVKKGQRIHVFGTLERVKNLENGEVFYQVIIGSGVTNNEYIRVE
jgi:hypothetical protein